MLTSSVVFLMVLLVYWDPTAAEEMNCGNANKGGREVFGGVEAKKHSWPWMALLGRRLGRTNSFFCGGALINHDYVITAAHCALDLAPFFVRLGEHKIEEHTVHDLIRAQPLPKIDISHEDISVENVLFHPLYDLEKGYYDVALLKLSRPVKYRRPVSPVCIPWGKNGTEDLVGRSVTITGWGAESFEGDPSMTLLEADVEVFDPSKCDESYSTLPDYSRTFPNGITAENMVCAGDPQWSKDSCRGDSGGPLVYRGKTGSFPYKTYFLGGIISKGFGCANEGFPGLYAPIQHKETLQWIKKNAFNGIT